MADEPEVIEGESVEDVPTPGTEIVAADEGGGAVAPPPSTLFHTDDPVEVVKRATEVANVLSEVLRQKELTKKIGNREHVLVEGWTLCGSMLGVFAVPIWSKKLTDPEGWEARVEARTITGAVIGAAEAQCTRDENMWSHNPVGKNNRKLEARDDFALRSMAQTRAAAKALRLPLGFIISLAGFEATPAEEMSSADMQPVPRRQEGAAPFPVPKSWPDIEKAVKQADNPDEAWALFQAYIRACSYHLYGKPDSVDLSTDERKIVAQKSAGAVVWLHENVEWEGPFRFFDEDKQRQAWAAMLDGHVLEIPDYVPPEPPADDVDEEAKRLAREVFAEDEAGNPYP